MGNNIKECNECANYMSTGCPFYVSGKGILIGKRLEVIENHNSDCFVTKENKTLCDMMCGSIERW